MNIGQEVDISEKYGIHSNYCLMSRMTNIEYHLNFLSKTPFIELYLGLIDLTRSDEGPTVLQMAGSSTSNIRFIGVLSNVVLF